ncbi:hypothetical protein DFQ50_10137 [Pseudocitrobacter faecalis]|uniref:Uncharacterized protein n=1 Tax=Pseudocitrobacter faecalis TaxID=1398493 RepID=A0ABX9G251_9ENTR|nr:hypothetical protein DFQ50_10137 [Pseudocitrobacter faecalis]
MWNSISIVTFYYCAEALWERFIVMNLFSWSSNFINS